MSDGSLYRRFIEARLLDALADTPAVLIHGPRQSGKSTLASMVGEPTGYACFTFDDDVARAAAEADPVGFVADLPSRAILDEAQRVPTLFTALEASIDRDRVPGRFILTGSANVLLVPKLADSLAGRMEILRERRRSRMMQAGRQKRHRVRAREARRCLTWVIPSFRWSPLNARRFERSSGKGRPRRRSSVATVRRGRRGSCPHCEDIEFALPPFPRVCVYPVALRSWCSRPRHAASRRDRLSDSESPRISMASDHATSAPASRVRMQLAGSSMDGFRRDGSALADTLRSKVERGARGGESLTNAHDGRLRLSGRGVRRSCRDPERSQTPG